MATEFQEGSLSWEIAGLGKSVGEIKQRRETEDKQHRSHRGLISGFHDKYGPGTKGSWLGFYHLRQQLGDDPRDMNLGRIQDGHSVVLGVFDNQRQFSPAENQ